MSLQQFKRSGAGAKIGPLLTSPAAILAMENKSRANRPAVEAVGKDIEDCVGSLSDDEKKLVGRWVKEILVPRGWRTDHKGRVAAGHFFSRGKSPAIWTRPPTWRAASTRCSPRTRTARTSRPTPSSPRG